MTEQRLSGILPIHVADDPVVLAAQLSAQEKFNPQPAYVATMRRKLQRLVASASVVNGALVPAKIVKSVLAHEAQK
jgi:hypothetical protein